MNNLNEIIRGTKFGPTEDKHAIKRDVFKLVFNSKHMKDMRAQREYENMIRKYDRRAKRRFYGGNTPKAQDIGSRETMSTLAVAKKESL